MKYFQRFEFDPKKLDQFELAGVNINYFGFKDYSDPLLSMINNSLDRTKKIENIVIHLTLQKPILRLKDKNFKHIIRDKLALKLKLNKKQIAIHAGTGEKVGKVGRSEAFDIHIIYNYEQNIRIGYGFDRHQLIKKLEKKLILAGQIIEYSLTIKSHSDGDLVFHVITDSLLAAISQGDIGEYFPETEEKWKGQNSQYFVDYALKSVKKENYQIISIEIKIFVSASLYDILINHRDFEINAVNLISSLCEIDSNNLTLSIIKLSKGCVGRDEAIEAEAIVKISK